MVEWRRIGDKSVSASDRQRVARRVNLRVVLQAGRFESAAAGAS